MNINKTLKYIIFGAIFLVPFVPFIVSNFLFFPFITGKAYAFRILVEIMVGAWGVLALRVPKYRPKKTWITISATIFIAIITLADILSVNPLKSIWSNYERMEGLVLMLHLLGFLFVTGSMMTKNIWHKFFNVSIFASVLMSFYGFFQMAGKLVIHQGSTRLDATFGNSAYLAVYLLINIFLALFFFFKQKKHSLLRWLYGVTIIFQTIILYNTATRGALLGLIGGLIVSSLFIIFFEKENLVFKKVAVGLLFSFFILIGLFLGFKQSSFIKNSPVLNRFATISLHDETTDSRFMVWKMAWEGFKEKPILGWGQESFNYVFNQNYNPKLYNQEQWFDRTHDVFFDWLISGGLLGLLGYLSLFGFIIFYLIKDKNNNFSVVDKAIFIGMLTGYFIHNLFVFDNLTSYILFFSFLGYIHSLNINSSDNNEKISPNNSFNFVAIPLVVILSIFSIYFFNFKSLATNLDLISALRQQKEGIVKNIDYYKKALAYDSMNNQEIREQLSQFTMKVVSSNISPNIKQKVFTLATTELQKQIKSDPNNARLEFITGTLFASAGVYDQSLQYLEKALKLSPKKESILVIIGNVYLKKGEYDKALGYFKEAYDLAPNFNDLRIMYAAGAIYTRNTELAKELLVPTYKTMLIDNPYILQAYIVTKQYKKVVSILELRAEKKPNDPQTILSLAAAYAGAGYKTKAIEGIRRVIKLNPNFKKQGEYYINQVLKGKI